MANALIPLPAAEPPPAPPSADVRLSRADFLAHLIATRAQVPQTRLRRRAEPAEAVAAYGSLGVLAALPVGCAVSRSL